MPHCFFIPIFINISMSSVKTELFQGEKRLTFASKTFCFLLTNHKTSSVLVTHPNYGTHFEHRRHRPEDPTIYSSF